MNKTFLSKRTKIVCTIGPASSNENILTKLIESGMDVARMNFSHSTHKEHEKVYNSIRLCEQRSGRPIGVLADLQGPKIRVGRMQDGYIDLQKGDSVWINTDDDFLGTKEEISTVYKNFVKDIEVGHKVLIDDGKIALIVIDKKGDKAKLEALVAGRIKDKKGINLPGTNISSPAMSEKDIEDLKFALSLGVDYVALSFVRSAEDLRLARNYLKDTFTGLIAKIERPEAITHIDEIISEVDGIMIARGDLGVELDTERVPLLQKELIRKMNLIGKPVITATQMLESMIDNPRPTRAEASDVANAVLDGTDAVMLSGESASGAYPVESVEIMTKIIRETEVLATELENNRRHLKVREGDDRTALGLAAEQIARQIHAKAIVNFTRSGFSARVASQYRPEVPIYSFTPFLMTSRKMNLHRGVYPFVIPIMDKFQDMLNYMNEKVKETGILSKDDTIVILSGTPGGVASSVDFVQIYKIR
ncbi:MAG: pyruvate kinase [Leptospiraceae bacterium]|nr:pyruvate kinase [Leptospiraceae bacterium]